MSTVSSGGSGSGYVAMHATAAVWPDRERVLLNVTGTSAARVLGGLLSADVAAMAPRSSLLSLLLNAKGRPLAVPRVLRLDDVLVLDVSRAAIPGLQEHFATYLPPRFAVSTELKSALRLSVIGPAWTEAAARLGIHAEDATVPVDLDLPSGDERPAVGLLRDVEDGGGFDVYDWSGSALETVVRIVTELGGTVATAQDYEVWRIEQGIPLFGVDITADNLPQETGLVERAVSFDKGCYTGQEVVARIHYRGHVNRHLRGVRWRGSEDPDSLPGGAELFREGRPAASVTSFCESPRFGFIALAYVRREFGPGSRLAVTPDGPDAWQVCERPFTST